MARANPTTNKRFVIGVDRAKMKLYDVEQVAQDGLMDNGQVDKPAFDSTPTGKKTSKFDNFKM